MTKQSLEIGSSKGPDLLLLSRGSDLAVIQAEIVADAIRSRFPAINVSLASRSSQGDRDQRIDLWEAGDKGLFTLDLSHALLTGECDAVVHSWKDLPLDAQPGTIVAGTLERADPRDILLVRREVLAARPSTLLVLTSSPRRAFEMQSLPALLPWRCTSVEARPVRGNVPTRLQKLIDGEADGLIVAKAALDRLLDPDSNIARAVRSCLDQSAWMVLPLQRFPTAPAQGALAIEVAAHREDVVAVARAITHEPTRLAVEAERAVLASYGGGCHEAIGATVLLRDCGRLTSIRGHLPSGETVCEWSLDPPPDATMPPKADLSEIYPRREERRTARRRDLALVIPADRSDLWIARAHALPVAYRQADSHLIWTAGLETWEKLAARGVWVHGSAEGLGDQEPPAIDRLAGRTPSWLRLTHDRSDAPGSLATYHVDYALPDDLGSRTHFFWQSGTLLREALDRHPGIRAGWHASGPGRTAAALREAIGSGPRISTWLGYDQWLLNITR